MTRHLRFWATSRDAWCVAAAKGAVSGNASYALGDPASLA
jgi:hypothetical protein